jgi:GTP-binding protein HflX
VAIVGYTNAGKSTLLNALTDADVLVEDRLFATLDPTVRRLELPNQRPFLLADTVGFVRRLPHHLVEAFRSTLAEVAEADLLLHVVDGSDPDPAGQIAAVREVLLEIGAAELPELIVFNKSDLMGEQAGARLANLYPEALFISALEHEGLEDLGDRIGDLLERTMVTLTLEIPYARGDVVAAAHRIGEVIEEKHDDNGMILEVRVPEASRSRFAQFSR